MDITYGVSKFTNINGVTCYMNSILAIIQQMPLFIDYILSADFKDQLMSKITEKELPDSVLFQLYNLLKISHSRDNYNIAPTSFRQIVSKKNDMWGMQMQQDSQEFLTFLLNSIEDELKINIKFVPGKKIQENDFNLEENLIRMMANNSWQNYIKKEYSIIKNLFGGLSHLTITCKYCNNKSHNFDIFQILQLSINNNINNTINDCLDEFVKEEEMDKRNMIKCSFCGKLNKSTKQTLLWKTPKILIIQLKRFMVNNYGVVTKKINTMIDYPINNFDISDYIDSISPYHDKSTYNLFAVNCHHSIGNGSSINFGHYTTKVKNRYDNKWYVFDDDKELEEVDDEDDLIAKSAYMLFYIRNN